MKTDKVRVCVISPEVIGPAKNGGIGTHAYYLAAFLRQKLGQEVSFLYTGRIEIHDEAYWRKWFQEHLAIEFAWIPPEENRQAVPEEVRSFHVQVARRVYEWLRARHFDVCHFQEMLGNGFRCFQAKRLGLAFQQTVLTCTVHSSWEWICQAMQALPQMGFEELEAKFMERYCTTHCDVLLSPSEYMLRWVEQEGIATPPHRFVLPYLFDPELRPVGHRKAGSHVIFFGRLEVRKGLLVFLEALARLDRQGAFRDRPLRVTFLGKSGYTPDGGGSRSIRKAKAGLSSAVQVEEVNDLIQPDALQYLAKHNDALIVCPSLVDNSPYVIIESLQLGLNIIAAECGGIPELFAGTDRLFPPEPEALAAKLMAALNNQLPPPAKRYDLETASRLWRQFCVETLPALPLARPAAGPRAFRPSVRVFLPGDLPGASLVEVLKSLQAQTAKPAAVSFLKSVRREPETLPEVEALCRAEGWDPVADAHASPLSEDYALFLEPGCVPRPESIEKLARGAEASGVAALTAWMEPARGGEPRGLFEPLGACLEGVTLANLFGAGCLLLPRSECPTGAADRLSLVQRGGVWSWLVKSALAGKPGDVLPEVQAGFDPALVPLTCTELGYARLSGVLRACGGQAPWLRYALLHAVITEQTARDLTRDLRQKEQQFRAVSNIAPAKVLYKLKRESSRFLKQCRSLFDKGA